MRTIIVAAAAVLFAGSAFADEQVIKLKPGAGLDKVESNCQACHTLAYIPMNSVYLNAAGWDAEVTKMINAYGAPVDAEDAKAIKAYLTQNYGK
ncbi:MAG TPA: cytochrome c [Pseudolabrys sp.]|jgi:mono/diheme cytochrome c family protein|nr:cytochrome c [Pseudolabrys sp.]